MLSEVINLKNIEKRGNQSARKLFFIYLKKTPLDIHMRNGILKFQSSSWNGVVILNANIQVYIKQGDHGACGK